MSKTIITTGDGSHSLLHTELNETYHSVHGAIRESNHVFIGKGLRPWLQSHEGKSLSVLEIGFGTGLNAFLTAMISLDERVPIEFQTIEAYPLDKEIWSHLNYTTTLGQPDLFRWIHEVGWDELHNFEDLFLLKKRHGRIQDLDLPEQHFDVIYFDAFAPSKQADMWTLEVLRKVCSSLAPEGIFVTYCAKGQLKRDLKSLGLQVETLDGPPGKKEMVRARF